MKHSHVINLLWRVALQEAVAARSQLIEPEHFFEALTKGGDFCQADVLKEVQVRGIDVDALANELRFVPELLTAAGINPTQLRRGMRALLGTGTYEHASGAVIHRSARSHVMLKTAEEIALKIGVASASAGTLFLAILSEKESKIAQLLAQGGHDAGQVMKLAVSKLKSGQAGAKQDGEGKPEPQGDSAAAAPRSILEQYGRDLTQAARDGLLSPVIGRRKEVLQVIQTLARSTKSNPVLVGEPGVGKTAIVEAIAQRIVDGKDPHVLGGKWIQEQIEIPITQIIADGVPSGTFLRCLIENGAVRVLAEQGE